MRFKPYPYQQYAIDTILSHPCCGLFLGMGLGKTVCTLTAVQKLMYESFEVSKVLVVAPLRVALDTWTREKDKWDHLKGLRVQRILGSASERKKALTKDADVYVINRENVTWLVQYLRDTRASWPFDMLVIDELSSFKNPKAKRFRALRQVRPLINRVVGLTGTPAPNGYMDLWPEVYLLDQGERLGKTITSYRAKYFKPGRHNGYVVYDWCLVPGAAEEIRRRLSDICVSMRTTDYLDLPDKRVIDIPITLPDEALKAYKTMEHDKILELGDAEITAFQAATVTGKLLQMANGAVYDDDGEPTLLHDAKVEALAEILEAAQGDPVLVFTGYRHDLARLKKKFKSYGPRTINSQKDIRDWNDGKIKLLIAHPASIGHGLNLQDGGHIIVWFGLTWSLELYQQANARLYRQGQKMPVLIYRLIAKGTVDEAVIKNLNGKNKRQDSLIEYLNAKRRKSK
jgi:SNF2 family DNA or RNA helicase